MPSRPTGRWTLGLIFATAFLNTMGATIVMPVLPYLVQRYAHGSASTALWVGVLASAFSACALLAAPVLGVVSDRVGRRPVLLLSLVGSAAGFVVFGIGGALWVLLLGRVIDGLTGGNISTIFAYLADITPPEERGSRFGFAGGVTGVGFMVGPAVGGLLSHFGLAVPVFAAAGIMLLNALAAAVLLPESHAPEHRREPLEPSDFNPFKTLAQGLARPRLRVLLLTVLVVTIPMAGLQSNMSVLAKDTLAWGPTQVGLLLFGVGILDILTQGVFVGVFLPKVGERVVCAIGLLGQAVGYVVLAVVASTLHVSAVFAAGALLFAASEGMMGPAMLSLVSKSVSHREQGWVQGGVQSMNSAARAAGPLLASLLYAGIGHAAPYEFGAVVMVIVIVFSAQFLRTRSA